MSGKRLGEKSAFKIECPEKFTMSKIFRGFYCFFTLSVDTASIFTGLQDVEQRTRCHDEAYLAFVPFVRSYRSFSSCSFLVNERYAS